MAKRDYSTYNRVNAMASTQDITFERGLPASIDAERSILGAVLLDNAHYNEAAEKHLRADDFALDSHRRIFGRMADMIDAGTAVDIVTLAEELSKRKEIEAVGGVAYLASLTEGLPRRISIEEYVRIVRDKSQLRQMIGILSTGVTDAHDQSDEAISVINRTETALLELSERGITRGFEDIPQIVRESFGTIDALWRHKREVTGLATHYKDFDEMTSGLQESELIIIAARPSMGKTAWAINIAQNAAIKDNKVVGIFSLEMSKESLLRRMLASEAFVNMRKIQTGFVSRDDQDKLMEAAARLTESKIHIDDTPGISLAEMRAKARRLKQKMGTLDLIVVDYLQLMSGSSQGGKQRQENRTQEVAAVSRGLKALAKEMRVPVIALSQLSRASEQRGGDKKPMLSDLRESGSIEQDADVVAFIHRESYYNKDENGEEDPESKGKAEIIIAKQRNGPTGSVHLAYLSEFTRFENLAHAFEGDNGSSVPY
jgi:replicative DNA helicase